MEFFSLLSCALLTFKHSRSPNVLIGYKSFSRVSADVFKTSFLQTLYVAVEARIKGAIFCSSMISQPENGIFPPPMLGQQHLG